mmetsp:Transcript_8275/g.17642  ORF Transcript_8275/g.17642 Transcript_8275/m.17642 type:complete len:150 (-) Transcript_8275:748-1197(-)
MEHLNNVLEHTISFGYLYFFLQKAIVLSRISLIICIPVEILKHRQSTQRKASQQSYCQNYHPQPMTQLARPRNHSQVLKRNQIRFLHLIRTAKKTFFLLNPNQYRCCDHNMQISPSKFVNFHHDWVIKPSSCRKKPTKSKDAIQKLNTV